MTDVSIQAPKEGIRYVLYNGLITGPMQTARGFLEAAAEVERKWR